MNEFGRVVQIKGLHDLVLMKFHRARGNVEPCRYLFCGASPHDKSEDLLLACGQNSCWRFVAVLPFAKHKGGDRRRDEGLTPEHGAHGQHELAGRSMFNHISITAGCHRSLNKCWVLMHGQEDDLDEWIVPF